MEEVKTVELIIGAVGLLFFIGIGVLLGYLINELRWRTKEDRRSMVDLVKTDRKFLQRYSKQVEE